MSGVPADGLADSLGPCGSRSTTAAACVAATAFGLGKEVCERPGLVSAAEFDNRDRVFRKMSVTAG